MPITPQQESPYVTRIREIRSLVVAGQITYQEAKIRAAGLIKEANLDGQQVAGKKGITFKPLEFEDFIPFADVPAPVPVDITPTTEPGTRYNQLLKEKLEERLHRSATVAERLNADKDADLVAEVYWEMICELYQRIVALETKNTGTI